MPAQLVEIDEVAERACDFAVLEQMHRHVQRHMGRAERQRTIGEEYCLAPKGRGIRTQPRLGRQDRVMNVDAALA